MQIRTLSCFAVTGLFFAGSISAWAQERERDREHDWDRAHRVIGKTHEDLRRIERHDAWAEADRGHYEAAERNLADIRRDLDENRLDRGRLDRAMEEIEHITHVDALDRPARERLTDDLRDLHRLSEEWHWR